jgi:hypothetical protein
MAKLGRVVLVETGGVGVAEVKVEVGLLTVP